MQIGVPKEIKNHENRVGITPAGVSILVKNHHRVLVEADAGKSAGYLDEAYEKAGAVISSPAEIWQSDMVMKVKEPLPEEYHYFWPGLILYTYLHLAANRQLAEKLLAEKVTAIGYETMQAADGSLPALNPMSEVAGRMAVLIGAQFLQQQYGGKGILLSGVPGVRKSRVTVIGGGVVGFNAAKTALGLGAQVTLLDINARVLANIDNQFDGNVQTLYSNSANIATSVRSADLVIGAVLIPGAKAPILVSEEMVASMEPGSVLVDIPIDQGGIFETTDHATTFDDPIYIRHGVVHYAVANVPGAVPKTATDALTSVTINYAAEIANAGVLAAVDKNKTIASGLNIYEGQVTDRAVAKSLNLDFHAI